MVAKDPPTGIWKILSSIGPGLVSACVVIGPGSIVASSQVGATYGYTLCWLIAIAVFCMMVYMSMAAKLGVVSQQSAGDLVAKKIGRPLAIVIGGSVFFITAAYQFGNNLGVHSALTSLLEYWSDPNDSGIAKWPIWSLSIVVINGLAIAFLFAFKDFYKALEKLMMVFVGLMLLAFLINLIFARPSLIALFSGFIPSLPTTAGESNFDISLLGMIGTTFIVAAAYYQSYLVRFKGWKIGDLKAGLIDARIGALIMACITIMIMTNAAATFHKPPVDDVPVEQLKFGNVGDVATQLEKAFGPVGHTLFVVGLFSAACSSFIVNAMIGGFMLADGFGYGDQPNDLRPRIFTVANLMIGMIIALVVIFTGGRPVVAIIAAQAITVVISPLLAAVLWWMTSQTDIMGEHKNKPLMHVGAAIGFVLLLVLAGLLVFDKIPKGVNKLLNPPKAPAEATK